MALPLLNIDDRNYRDILAVLKSALPANHWTDHNPSDPGIMLLELLAWLGESFLYQMNRITPRHQLNYLKLILDPPEPVLVYLDFEFTLSSDRAGALVFPAGFRVSTDFIEGKRYVFETLNSLELNPPAPPDNPADPANTLSFNRRIEARCLHVVENEFLGLSNGKPNQSFSFLNGPILEDFVHQSLVYTPNPIIETELGLVTTSWEHVQFFPDEEPSGGDPLPLHFRINAFDNQIIFGDGIRSAIPEADAQVWARSYQTIMGPEALVDEMSLVHLMDSLPTLLPGESIVYHGNSPAFGGRYHHTSENKISDGLKKFRESFRLVTRQDFKTAILEGFNEYQELAGRPERIIQALPMMDRRPPLSLNRVSKGNVTILLIPEILANREDSADPVMEEYDLLFTDPNLLSVSPELEEKLMLFLDERRLLCTRIHFVPASLHSVNIRVTAVIESNNNVEEMRENISYRIHKFLNIREGGLSGEGWNLGQTIYRSHLFRILEEMEGVDHVSSLDLSPSDVHGDVPIPAASLPFLAASHPVVSILRNSE